MYIYIFYLLCYIHVTFISVYKPKYSIVSFTLWSLLSFKKINRSKGNIFIFTYISISYIICHFWGSSFLLVDFSYDWHHFLIAQRTPFIMSCDGPWLSVLVFWECFYFMFSFEIYFLWVFKIFSSPLRICNFTAFWPYCFYWEVRNSSYSWSPVCEETFFTCGFQDFSLWLWFSTVWL